MHVNARRAGPGCRLRRGENRPAVVMAAAADEPTLASVFSRIIT
jgi:hypothetical protein